MNLVRRRAEPYLHIKPFPLFSPYPPCSPWFFCSTQDWGLLQRLLNLGDEQVAVDDAEARVGQIALLVVDERGGYLAVPVFSDLIHHLLLVVGVLPDDVEFHLML